MNNYGIRIARMNVSHKIAAGASREKKWLLKKMTLVQSLKK